MNASRRVAAILEVIGVFITGVVLTRVIAQAIGLKAGGIRNVQADVPPDYLALAWTSAANLLLRYGIILALAFVIGWWFRRRCLADYGVTTARLSLRQILVIAVVLFSIGGLLPRLILFLKDYVALGRGPEHWEILSATYSFEFWVYMAVSSFGLVPIVEELFFRGYVQTRLTDGFGAPAAIVMTAVLFMLSHRQYFIASGVGIGMLLSLLIGSLIGGYARYRFGTLLPGIVAHAIGNLPIRGWVQALLLGAMLIIVLIARRAILAHARELTALLASRGVLSGAAVAVVAIIGVLGIAILKPVALPALGLVALLVALEIQRRNPRSVG